MRNDEMSKDKAVILLANELGNLPVMRELVSSFVLDALEGSEVARAWLESPDGSLLLSAYVHYLKQAKTQEFQSATLDAEK